MVISDPSAFRHATPFLGPRNLPPWFSGGTAIGMALRECLRLLVEREEGDRMIIHLTDGEGEDTRRGAEREVIAKLRDSDFRIVLLDVKMPGIDGLEFIRRLKSDYPVPVIVLTGPGRVRWRQGLSAGERVRQGETLARLGGVQPASAATHSASRPPG